MYILTLRTRRYQTFNVDFRVTQIIVLFNIWTLQSTIYRVINKQLQLELSKTLKQYLAILRNIKCIIKIVITTQVRNRLHHRSTC